MFLLEFGVIRTTVSSPGDPYENGVVSAKDPILTQPQSSGIADPRDSFQALVTESQRSFMRLVVRRLEAWITDKQVCDLLSHIILL